VNTIVWIFAGAALAWLAFSFLDYNRGRGLVIAVVIGAMGAYFGGSVLAPLLGHTSGAGGEFMPFALMVALATAIALLYIGDAVYERYGV
jgi:uncharacterized membrane protein YeaQ/YmgE (transglycosylase-associated protein family)